MGQMLDNLGENFKRSSATVGLLILKIFTGLILGLAFTMIGQEIFQYGQFLFWFVIILTMSVVYKLTKTLAFTGTLVFIFICILIGLLLKLYIRVAPN